MDEKTALVAAYSICWEGCISVSFTKKEHKGKIYPYFVPNIQISGTNEDLLRSFLSLVNMGKVYKVNRKGIKQKPVYIWRLSGAKNMQIFCEEVIPYLPTKRRQAELMIEFCKRRVGGQTVHNKDGYHSRYTFREVEIWEEMKQLNKRGVTRLGEVNEG